MIENNRVEFKSELNDKFEKEVSAFLNTEGGTLYIGVNDDGSIHHLNDLDQLQLKISDRLKNNILPTCLGLFDIHVEEINNERVLKIIFSSGLDKPYYIKKYGMSVNGCFMRVGSSSLPMSQNMIDDLYSRRINKSLRNIISPRQNLSFSQLKIYYQEKGLELNNHFAESLELLTPEGKYNYLAYLLADENGVSIKVAKYTGNTKVELIENEEYGYCSLLKATNRVLDKLRIENITKAQITDRTRIEKNLVDTVALREAVINALVHNDYTTEFPPVFEIFSNRITVTSYGGLIHNQSLEEFYSGGSMPRNRELMRVFKDIGLVEQLGSGMDRILKSYDRSIFNISPHIIKVEFPIESVPNSVPISVPNSVPNSVPKDLTETQFKILQLIKDNTMIPQNEIAIELNMTVSGVKRAMKKMQENNIIKREGSNRIGKWIILE